MKLPSFKEYYTTIKLLEDCINADNKFIEDFFDKVDESGLDLECIMTSDIAGMTLPIGMLPRRYPNNVNNLSEVAPNDPEIEKIILRLKTNFKKRYGDNWEKVLYGYAWNLYNKKHNNEN